MDLSKRIDKFCNVQYVVRLSSQNTLRAYRVDLTQFAKFIEKDIKDINLKDLRSFLSYLSQRGISKRSIGRKLSSIKSFFHWLHSSSIITSNPATLLNMPKFSKDLPDVLLPKEFNRMMQFLGENDTKSLRDKLLISLLYSSGLRSSEALSIKKTDISTSRCEVRVVGKGGRERIAFFNQETRRLLIKYLALVNADEPFLFDNGKGGALSTRFLRLMVEKLAKKVALDKKISPHTFRHSFATLLLSNGVNLKVIQDLLGHASISSTQIYTHISKEELRMCYMKYGPFSGGE